MLIIQDNILSSTFQFHNPEDGANDFINQSLGSSQLFNSIV